ALPICWPPRRRRAACWRARARTLSRMPARKAAKAWNILAPCRLSCGGVKRVFAAMRLHFVSLLTFTLIAGPAVAAPLDMQAINDAQWRKAPTQTGISPLLIKAQALLDRAHFSPGEIDGKNGDNLKKALTAFAAAEGVTAADKLTEDLWQRLSATSADPVLVEYITSDEDFRGPFLDKVPNKLEEMKELPALGY